MKLYQEKIFGSDNQRVIFLLGGWGTRPWMLWPVSKILQMSGFFCVNYTFDDQVLTPNMKITVKNIVRIKQVIKRKIRLLSQRGITDFSLFGTSLGAWIGTLVANEEPLIRKVILNTPGIDAAQSMWGWGKILPKFKQELVSYYPTLEDLKKEIFKINPINQIGKLQDKEIMIYISTKDEMVYCSPDKVKEILHRYKYKYKLFENNYLGHQGTGIVNLLNAPRYLVFLNGANQQNNSAGILID
jgi:hypothetical protein